MSENLTRDAFAEQLNTKFYIHFTPEAATEAELVEVTELKKIYVQESFSVFFLAPLEPQFEQRIYQIEHSQLGAFELFLVAVNRKENGIKYEAVFNRLTE